MIAKLGFFVLIIFILMSFKQEKNNSISYHFQIKVNLEGYIGNDTLQYFNNKLHSLVIEGKIPAYKNDSLLSSLTTDELKELCEGDELLDYKPDSISDSNFNYDRIIKVSLNPDNIKFYFVGMNCIYNPSQKNFKIIPKTISFAYKLFKNLNIMQSVYYVSKEDLYKYFEKEFIDRILIFSIKAVIKSNYNNNFKSNGEYLVFNPSDRTYSICTKKRSDTFLINKHFGDTSILAINFSEVCGPSFLRYILNRKIYYTIVSSENQNNIKAYKDDNLKESYSYNDLLSLGAGTEIVEFYPDPFDYPDYYIDSVIVSPYRPESTIYHFVSLIWDINHKKTEAIATINSISLAYQKENLFIPLFWVRKDDLNKILNNTEQTIYYYGIFLAHSAFYDY